jgi:hypothetical protein
MPFGGKTPTPRLFVMNRSYVLGSQSLTTPLKLHAATSPHATFGVSRVVFTRGRLPAGVSAAESPRRNGRGCWAAFMPASGGRP